jgi:hypothetical protein
MVVSASHCGQGLGPVLLLLGSALHLDPQVVWNVREAVHMVLKHIEACLATVRKGDLEEAAAKLGVSQDAVPCGRDASGTDDFSRW